MKRRVYRALSRLRLTAAVLLLALCSCGPRQLYADRSIPALVGWSDAEKYIQALRWTPLGIFGLTWQELVEAGYITENEGTWSDYTPEKRMYTVRRTVGRTDSRTDYIFRTTLFTEAAGKQVLTDIRVEYAPADKDNMDYLIRAQGKELLEGWTVLFERFAQFDGRYTQPLATGENEVWEFLDWEKRPDELEDFMAAVNKGWDQSYSVRCSPVTLGDCLTPEELNILADLAVEKGWAKDMEEGLEIFRGWHLAAFVGKNPTGHWDYSGMGVALYLTRPGVKGDGSH